MANTKSAIKQIRVSERRRQRNRPIRTRVKTAIGKALDAIGAAAGNDETVASVTEALSQLDRAASKGVIHPNNAARRKSRLMKKLNSARSRVS